MEVLTFEKLKEMKEFLDDDITFKEKLLEWKGDLKQIQTEFLQKFINDELGIFDTNNIKLMNDIIKIIMKEEIKNKADEIVNITYEDEKKVYIIGDLHQDLYSLNKLLNSINLAENFKNTKIIFLGDYIDRGKDILILINKLIILKYLLPNNIYLLRGNHELYRIENDEYHTIMANPDISYHFELLTQINKNPEKHQNHIKAGLDKELIKLYANYFDNLPKLCLIDYEEAKILAVHGGLPRFKKHLPYKNFDELLHSQDYIGIEQWKNMLWSDPYDGDKKFFKQTSEIRFQFSQTQFNIFCKTFNIDFLIRSHEQFEDGYKKFYNDRLITIFSNGSKNKDGKIINDKSAYTSVIPKYIELSKDYILIKELDGTLKEQITLSKFSPEVKEMTYEKAKCDNSNVLKVFNYLNSSQFKIFRETKTITFNYSNLQEFYGIPTNLSFELDLEKREIINKSDFMLEIGIKGVILDKFDKIKIKDQFILKLKESYLLFCLPNK